MKQLAAERMKKENLFWNYLTTKERGYKSDLRAIVFDKMQNSKNADLIDFQQEVVKGRAFTWLVLGEKKRIDFTFLKSIGPVKELSLEEVFGY